MSRLLGIASPRLIKTLACTAIVGLTLAPAFGHMTRDGLAPNNASSDPQIATTENRYLTPFPTNADSFTDFTAKVDSHLNDHFALRSVAIKAHQKLQRSLGGAKLPVYAGRDGWVFLGEDLVWASHQGRVGYTHQTVQAFDAMVRAIQTRCNDTGAAFVATISPNKASIYTEHTPHRFGQKSDRNFHDTVMSTLDVEALNLVNLKPILLAEKDKQQLYYKTDTHWTDYGAFLGYRALMQRLIKTRPEIKIIKEKHLKKTVKTDYKGDLTKIGDLKNTQEAIQLLKPKITRKFTVKHIENSDHTKDWRTAIHTVKGKPLNHQTADTPLKLVIIGDSFSNRQIKILRSSFDEIINIHHKLGGFEIEDIFAHDPDAVIFSVAERFADVTAEGFTQPEK